MGLGMKSRGLIRAPSEAPKGPPAAPLARFPGRPSLFSTPTNHFFADPILGRAPPGAPLVPSEGRKDPPAAPFGELWRALGRPWGDPGAPSEATFGRQAALQNHLFYYMKWYILHLGGGLGGPCGRPVDSQETTRRTEPAAPTTSQQQKPKELVRKTYPKKTRI